MDDWSDLLAGEGSLSLDWSFLDFNDTSENDSSLQAVNCCSVGICDPSADQDFDAVFIPILYSLAFFVGTLGNGLLLGVLSKSRRNWSVADTFIFHLAVADILLLLTMPLWAATAAQAGGWSFGTPLCKCAEALFTINFYCGIFLLACISIDRYLSIVHATQMFSRRNPRFVQVSCLAVWILSFLLSIPEWIFREAVKDVRRDVTECTYSTSIETFNDLRFGLRLLYHIAGFLLPSAILIFCYSSILQRLKCSAQGLQKQRAFRVIVAIVVVFFICWTPYNIVLMVDTLHTQSDDMALSCGAKSSLQIAMTVTSSIGFLHCSLNPILYAFVGVKFRRQLLDILRSLGCKLKAGSKRTLSAKSSRTSVLSESADTSNSLAI
ncbi:C-X-C chemokine receptor type 3.1 [Synchiropus picturatus]